jgi:hypothetical protein
MTDTATEADGISPAVERIDRAIARIQAAIDARADSTEALARRHAVLRSRMTEAVAALDDVIARGGAR